MTDHRRHILYRTHPRREDPFWVVTRTGSDQTDTWAETREYAIEQGKQRLAEEGGGTLVVHDEAGDVVETIEVERATSLTVKVTVTKTIEIPLGAGDDPHDARRTAVECMENLLEGDLANGGLGDDDVTIDGIRLRYASPARA
jgi:hypothetical protein